MAILHHIPIIDAWKRLGGGDLQGRGSHLRGRAHWRDGDGFNVSLDTDKNCYFDHRDGRGGGVLALVETALGCGRPDALKWLSQNCGLEHRYATPAEHTSARRRQWEAEQPEEQLQPAYRAFLRELERRRDQLLFLLRRVDDPDLELELEVCYWRIDTMRRAIGDDVDPDAAALTTVIVRLLELAERNRDESREGA